MSLFVNSFPPSTHRLGLLAVSFLFLAVGTLAFAAEPEKTLELRLRSRVPLTPEAAQYSVQEKAANWKPSETAIIVCDVWDLHHCLNAVRRVKEMAPTMERVLKTARDQGVLIIHAPSDCMDSYKDHPGRKRAIETPKAKNLPAEIGKWCYRIPPEEKGTYPIDQTDGGEDDDPKEHKEWEAKLASLGRNPRLPWKSETDLLTIGDSDLISDRGEEIWSVMEARGIRNVILLGVHTNMCVLGRPFGLRQMAKNGKNVVLMRDMTDTMYNPARSPFVSHFVGTDLIIEHIEKFVCPTITSDQLVGGTPFRFKGDARPHLALVIAEDEYQTEKTLPPFAAAHLIKDYAIDYVFAKENDRNSLAGLGILNNADVALISVRRRVLPAAQVEVLQRFVSAGKGVVGIRTASHAFSARSKDGVPEGHRAWDSFDADVLGGNYHGHHGPSAEVAVRVAEGVDDASILKGVEVDKILGHGSLYKVSPLAKSSKPLLIGTIPGQPTEPVAWTHSPSTGNRVFYTSLGHPDDFRSPAFLQLLHNALNWVAASRSAQNASAGSAP